MRVDRGGEPSSCAERLDARPKRSRSGCLRRMCVAEVAEVAEVGRDVGRWRTDGCSLERVSAMHRDNRFLRGNPAPAWAIANRRNDRKVTPYPISRGERAMPRIRVMLVATLLVLACASCSRSDDPPAAGPRSPSTDAGRSSPSPSPTKASAVPAYLRRFDADERQAYRQAKAADAAFERHNDRFITAHHLTNTANAYYHKYSVNWVDDWSNLAALVNNDVRVRGRASVLWTRPDEVNLAAKRGKVVTLSSCLDEHNIQVRQHGRRLKQPQLLTPHVYRVEMLMRTGETWWRTGDSKQVNTC
jgi:hypothetical protein